MQTVDITKRDEGKEGVSRVFEEVDYCLSNKDRVKIREVCRENY